MEREVKPVNDLELLTVNKELIKTEKHNGFAIKKNKFLMKVKNIPANAYKLAVVGLAAISETVPEFINKIPGVKYVAGLLVDGAKIYATDQTFEVIFNKLIVPYYHLVEGSDAYKSLWYEFTNSQGAYYSTSVLIRTVALFIMEHPGLVIAGGAVLAGLAYTIVKAIGKGVVNRIKYNKMNDKEKEIYRLLKDILKHARKIKSTENGKILVNDLKITIDIIDHLSDYPHVQDKILLILEELKKALDSKNNSNFEKYRLELETLVFDFEKENGDVLFERMKLIEDSEANIKGSK